MSLPDDADLLYIAEEGVSLSFLWADSVESPRTWALESVQQRTRWNLLL
jgi:hypothetical protein